MILDQRALIKYILKYQLKAEKRSDACVSTFHDLLKLATAEGHTVKRLLTKALNLSLVERDYHAVEAMHLLQGLPLVDCSHGQVRIVRLEACARACSCHRAPAPDDARP